MYHAAVRKITRQGFEAISAGQCEPVLRRFHPSARLVFQGHSVLGGEWRGPHAARRWFNLLFQLFPGLHLEAERMQVSGWPWRTVVITHFQVRAPLPGGRTYTNAGVQVLQLAWGRITEDLVLEDTARLDAALKVVQPPAAAPS